MIPPRYFLRCLLDGVYEEVPWSEFTEDQWRMFADLLGVHPDSASFLHGGVEGTITFDGETPKAWYSAVEYKAMPVASPDNP